MPRPPSSRRACPPAEGVVDRVVAVVVVPSQRLSCGARLPQASSSGPRRVGHSARPPWSPQLPAARGSRGWRRRRPAVGAEARRGADEVGVVGVDQVVAVVVEPVAHLGARLGALVFAAQLVVGVGPAALAGEHGAMPLLAAGEGVLELAHRAARAAVGGVVLLVEAVVDRAVAVVVEPSHCSGTAFLAATQTVRPFTHRVVPAAHSPGCPVAQALPVPGTSSSTRPSQSSSTPSQVASPTLAGKIGQRYSQPLMSGRRSLYPGSHGPTPHSPTCRSAWRAARCTRAGTRRSC
jgi:hypothetical protein